MNSNETTPTNVMPSWLNFESAVSSCSGNSTDVSLKLPTTMFNPMFNRSPIAYRPLAANAAGSGYPENKSVWVKPSAIPSVLRKTMLLAAGLIALIGLLQLGQAENVALAWDYPTNELLGVTFRVKMAPSLDIPYRSWVTLAETTNLTVRFEMVPAVYYFAVTASNYWSKVESPFSNIVQTPPVVRTNVTITITKP